MAIIIGSARIGENGKATGGKDGDQTKREVSTQNFYVHSKGWYILRAKDPKVAQKLAKAMKIACDNDNIGYNQNERYDVVKQGVETKKPCNSDCSALVRACIIWATGKDVGNFRTIDEVQFLEKSGLFEKHKAYTKQADLYNGDILVTKTQGHTVIVVSGAKERSEKSTATTKTETKTELPTVPNPTIKNGSKGADVKNLQKCLNYIGIKDSNNKALTVDSECGNNTVSAIKNFQKKYGLTADGIYGAKTAAKLKAVIKGNTTKKFVPYKVKITCDSLNVRAGAGTNYRIKTTVHKNGIYTIVAEKDGWGKLLSGAGWLKLSLTKKV